MNTGEQLMHRVPSRGASFMRAAWFNLVLILVAGVCVAAGFYLRARPEWAKQNDIREYNLGRATYNEMPTTRGANTVEAASAHFEKAIAETRNQRIRALALCNLGTIIGKQAFDSIREIRRTYAVRRLKGVESDENLLMARQEIRKAIQRLAEAVRIDPGLADAKYNLDLLETERGGTEVRGSAYSPGQVDKGY
jgi:hypothetical protein